MIRIIRRTPGLTYCRYKHSTSGKDQFDETHSKIPFNVKEEDMKNDWIGPPDPLSNLRPIKYCVPEDESPSATSYRYRRQETQDWNQEFWARHNISFYELKEKFVQQKLEEKKNEGPDAETLSAEEMSIFYKKFLDDNYKMHISYNREWYTRTILLLWPALKLYGEKITKKFKK